ncbi:MAG UNVERIFIED_CONTAM: hypothetical protein LVR29_22040 [Microcystis novacekii LVE1205-3]|jgi:hypothetical protein
MFPRTPGFASGSENNLAINTIRGLSEGPVLRRKVVCPSDLPQNSIQVEMEGDAYYLTVPDSKSLSVYQKYFYRFSKLHHTRNAVKLVITEIHKIKGTKLAR